MQALQAFFAKIETEILNPIITLVALAAFIVFVWGVVEFIGNADNDEKRAIGQRHIIWGLVGLVILFGAKGIVALLSNTLGQFGL